MGINPEFVLNSDDVEGTSLAQSTVEEASNDLDRPNTDDIPSSSRDGQRNKRFISEKLDELIEEKKKFHSDLLDHLKKKEEAREQRSNKKIYLLEKLMNKH
ncbi:uncharacterized protein LOC118753649 [Rhagoletis pomonella]|uniref:uncharacterized protein LOC118750723 n=1 Tax=Rhagoletis pomonella TaxID=28610 RepID=UPI00177E1FBB|nr:uncharacterized protein LOC118750723 [Rhagoletis pomonella]XP_036344414.1 uncharacterized protein LOC118753649 [Rhagoletis pomonella]